ncbi:hypothetical protein QBC38DRAFT_196567 [Podospora fimiseda]|uniref:Uncharacterized protein n=1 Tax=Podospora fimiseda TaxID=252190 RepID=A0AAN7H2L0_9PEZI|nr:hypothetical protein QBC38DRAFT_196567 [Podospora fimiseda]
MGAVVGGVKALVVSFSPSQTGTAAACVGRRAVGRGREGLRGGGRRLTQTRSFPKDNPCLLFLFGLIYDQGSDTLGFLFSLFYAPFYFGINIISIIHSHLTNFLCRQLFSSFFTSISLFLCLSCMPL